MLTDGQKKSIERDFLQSQSAFESIVKYAFTANGTALALSVGALSKISGTIPMAQIGKLPMIVFLIGLAFAGFHLLFAYSAGIWSARETIEQQLADLEKELDKTSANALQKYVIDSDLTSTASKLKSMIADMQEIKKQDPPLDTAKVRKYSETMIVLSYAAFFLGALVVIYRA